MLRCFLGDFEKCIGINKFNAGTLANKVRKGDVLSGTFNDKVVNAG